MAELAGGMKLVRAPLLLPGVGLGLGWGHSPKIASVCCILDMVADIGEHFLRGPAVPSIKYLGPEGMGQGCRTQVRFSVPAPEECWHGACWEGRRWGLEELPTALLSLLCQTAPPAQNSLMFPGHISPFLSGQT